MRSNTIKSALKAGKVQVGTWLSLASPFAARYMAHTGFDWLCVDIEHTPANWESIALMFGAIADAGCIPLSRIPYNSIENAKRALDNGAYGLVFPMCSTAQEAKQAVSSCLYPPAGERSVGGSIHALNFNCSPSEYYRNANNEILIIAQTEHRLAVENIDSICATPGVDVVFVGPNDLLSSMHKTPAVDSDDPEYVAALKTIRETANRYGIAPGIHVADAEAAKRRIAEGWRFIAVSNELNFMLAEATSTAQKIKNNLE